MNNGVLNHGGSAVLWLSPQQVYPPTDGGKRGIYYPVVELSRRKPCYFAYFHDLPAKAIAEQTAHFNSLHIPTLPIHIEKRESAQVLLRSLCRLKPLKFSKYHSLQALQQITAFIQARAIIDTIVVSHAHLGWYARRLKKQFPAIKIILREHNIEYDLVRQYAQAQRNLLKKALINGQYLLSKLDEQTSWANVDETIFISDSDVELAKHNKTFDQIHWRIAYDGNSAQMNPSADRHGLLFAGSLQSPQNAAALRHFIEHYWQPWQQVNPDRATLSIAGNNEQAVCQCLHLSTDVIQTLSIRPLGFVPDLQREITTHALFLSPTTIGSGIRVKVIEAMSQGALVLLSETDYKMCRFFEHGRNVLRYRNYQEFTDSIELALQHPEAAQAIRVQAYDDAKKYFDWQILIDQIIEA